MDGPEDEGLEDDSHRDGAVLEATDPPAARAIVQRAGEERERALATRAVPELRQLGIVGRTAVEQLDRDAMAGERVVELAQHGLQLRAHVHDPRAGERRGQGGEGPLLRETSLQRLEGRLRRGSGDRERLWQLDAVRA